MSEEYPLAGHKILDLSDGTSGWYTIQVSGEWYLYRLACYPGYMIGAFGNCQSLSDGIFNTEQERYYYCDAEGNLYRAGQENRINLTGETGELDGENWYVFSAPSQEADFVLVKLVKTSVLKAQLISVGGYILIVAGIFVLLLMVYILFLNRWIRRPSRQLRDNMEVIADGNLNHRIPELKNASTEFQNVADEFNYLMDYIESLKISMYEKELEQKEVRLEYLNRQIQPHFVLNTLNTLYNYSDSDREAAKEMIRLISDYYRYVVNVNSQFVQLGQELDHIDRYLQLQMMRYPRLFVYEIRCPEELRQTPIPPFIIESFIGNTFKHGLIPGVQNRIDVEAQALDNKQVLIRIRDTGAGFSDDSLDAIREFLEEKTVSEELGVGIRNSIERLHLIYQDRCSIQIYNRPEGGATVEVEVPEAIHGDTGTDRG